MAEPWNSLIEGDEQPYQPIGKSTLKFALTHTAKIKMSSWTAAYLSHCFSPSTKVLHGLFSVGIPSDQV